MADSPMYAVINNSMGSGSVTYECEGYETRQVDCMSPLSSTIAPCYYALVKCFSTTDKTFGESNKTTDKTSGGSNKSSDKKSRGSTTSEPSAGIIVAGVVVPLLAVLLVVTIVIIILIVRSKRRAKPGDNTATTTSPRAPSPIYASPVAVTGETGTSNKTLKLTDPTYCNIPTHFQPAQTYETLEYKFDNLLYTTPTEAGLNES